MREYIDREKFLAEKRNQYCADCERRKGIKRGKTVFCYEIGDAPCRSCEIGDILDDVEEYPTTDVVELKHGRWIEKEDKSWKGYGKWECSVCGNGYAFGAYFEVDKFNYCPNCGAKMDGGADDAVD